MVSLFLRHPAELKMCLDAIMKFVLITVVFRLYYDSPSCWKDVVMEIQLDRLEEESSKDGLDAQVLSIGEMHNARGRGHPFPLRLSA